MSKLTTEQLVTEITGLLDRLSERLGGKDVYIGNRTTSDATGIQYYLVKVGNLSVANTDPVVALYECLGKHAEWEGREAA